MSFAPVYLDHAATSPVRPQVREAVLKAWDMGANASSVHAAGRKAKLLLEQSRDTLLTTIGAVGVARAVFTSGGTEANHLALVQARGFDRLIISATEHDSIFKAAEQIGLPVTVAPVLGNGLLDIAAFETLLGEGGRPFVCVMRVNNETGVIQPIEAIAPLVKAAGGWLHVDAVQALGKIAVDFTTLGSDSLSFAAHKIGGPQGVGALVYDNAREIRAAITGGGQEFGLRAGTENIAGIAGFAEALRHLDFTGHEAQSQAEAETALVVAGATIIAAEVERAGGVTCFTVPDWAAQLQLIHMDMGGICVSSGSACSSGKVKSSRVLEAMGLSDVADKALRVSSGWNTTPADWRRFVDVWAQGYLAHKNRQLGKVKESA